ncbi:MAG: hypothetical protein KF796_19405 [Ramlibacter sp.]|nr:hypothetical protein [Ramlibacter sp.]
MPKLIERRVPYEFLVRWNPATGLLQGAHVKTWGWVEKDGVPMPGTAAASPAAPVTDGPVEGGVPLGEVLTDLHVAALATIAARDAQIVQLQADHEAALAAKDAQIAALQQAAAPASVVQPDEVNVG